MQHSHSQHSLPKAAQNVRRYSCTAHQHKSTHAVGASPDSSAADPARHKCTAHNNHSAFGVWCTHPLPTWMDALDGYPPEQLGATAAGTPKASTTSCTPAHQHTTHLLQQQHLNLSCSGWSAVLYASGKVSSIMQFRTDRNHRASLAGRSWQPGRQYHNTALCRRVLNTTLWPLRSPAAQHACACR